MAAPRGDQANPWLLGWSPAAFSKIPSALDGDAGCPREASAACFIAKDAEAWSTGTPT